MGKIIPLNNVTKLDIPVDRVLDQAKGELKGAVVIGFDKSGELYTASSFANGGTVMWLLEACKQRLLEGVGE